MNRQLHGHSFQGQDLFVIEVLQGQDRRVFLDSGASNGVRGSNTWLLEKAFGWTGLCVEPNEGMFKELVRNRPGPCVSCCLYDGDGEVDFLERQASLAALWTPMILRCSARLEACWEIAGRQEACLQPCESPLAHFDRCCTNSTRHRSWITGALIPKDRSCQY